MSHTRHTVRLSQEIESPAYMDDLGATVSWAFIYDDIAFTSQRSTGLWCGLLGPCALTSMYICCICIHIKYIYIYMCAYMYIYINLAVDTTLAFGSKA